MAGLELLDARSHAQLRALPATAAGRHFVQVVPGEFGRIAARCPILFTKHPDTGAFYAGALFGVEAAENLLVDQHGQLEGFVPLDVEREGFFISGDSISIDPASSRFTAGGAVLFEEAGEPSGELKRVQRALASLKIGLEESEAFIRTLLAHRLIESIDISLSFDDGSQAVLDGLYTISRDALHDLDDEVALSLFRSGYLQLAYIVIESLNQISLLARRRNDRLAGL